MLGFLGELGFFDLHVFEFARLENLSALFALDVLGVFIARDNLHTRVLAWLRGLFLGS